MTDWIPLDIKFKGERDYLQSANVWDAVAQHCLEAFTDVGNMNEAILDVVFKKIMHNKVELWLGKAPAPKDPNMVAQVVLKLTDGSKKIGLLRETEAIITERFEDVENQFKPDVQIDAEKAHYQGEPLISLSQIYVAMIKFWHQAQVDNNCKWLATRLQLPLGCLNARPSKVEIKPATILKDGAGSINVVSSKGAGVTDGRIYFFKSCP